MGDTAVLMVDGAASRRKLHIRLCGFSEGLHGIQHSLMLHPAEGATFRPYAILDVLFLGCNTHAVVQRTLLEAG